MSVQVLVADKSHFNYAQTICDMMESAAKVRGTGIAKREPAYVCEKMGEGKAIIALDDQEVVGFCYIESWSDEKYVANSGLIVHPDYRNTGLARKIKEATFNLSVKKFPNAKLFGITTSLAVMKINSDLGYKPVTFSELTPDEKFWNGCKSCVNYDILQRTNKTMCICTGMICDLKTVAQNQEKNNDSTKGWDRFKGFLKQRKTRIQNLTEKFPKLVKRMNYEK